MDRRYVVYARPQGSDSYLDREIDVTHLSVYSSVLRSQLLTRLVSGQSRFLRLFGQHEACLNCTESIYEGSNKESDPIGFGLLSMFFFDAPHRHMVELEKLYVDGTVTYMAWDRLIRKMQDDWTKSLIPVCFLTFLCDCPLTLRPRILFSLGQI